MKRVIIILLVLTTNFSSLFADKFYYTVIAKSGLSIRENKDINSQKLGVAEFKSEVEVLGLYREDKITVEDVEGFWIYVNYNEIKGYMYSGYLFPGRIFDTSHSESEYIVMDEIGEDFTFIKNGSYELLNYSIYDNNRNWYGVLVEDSITRFEPVTIELNISVEKIQKYHDSKEKLGYFEIIPGKPFPLDFSISPQKDYNFFIGTNKIIKGQTESQKYQRDGNKRIGQFIHPWKEISIGGISKFALRAKGTIAKNPFDSTQQTIIYQLLLKDKYRNEEFLINHEFYYFRSMIDIHVMYENPKLIWTGYVNEDDIPDLIFEVNIMADKCAQPWMELLISERKGEKLIFKSAKPGFNFKSIE